MIDTLIPCDNCGNVFNKPTNKITKVNFCCRDCMDRYNSERFSNYNETENPMNAKGRTIEERFAMRDRRMNAKDRVGKDVDHEVLKKLIKEYQTPEKQEQEDTNQLCDLT